MKIYKSTWVRLRNSDGFTLVELMAAVAIFGIVTSGLVAAYVTGINYWRSTSELSTLRSEGSTIMGFIEQKMRTAQRMIPRPFSGRDNAWLGVTYLRKRGRGMEASPVDIDFYYVTEDNTLRMNDLSGSHGIYNLPILPMYKMDYNPNQVPYLRVTHLDFTPCDPLPPTDPTTEGYSMITVNLTLENTRGDTLCMSSTISKRN